ncbi:hypothetical protein PR003_g25426 [Phytophthora rubi]|uniref:Uncharacterized protein n=1 Tax=Phytophthora rubi TaxID=129364 RepID=A0A6A3KV96_9STRA|nr:hypothetical protein PR002_g16946 [Phytophthora rubi]KAE9009527.1 hypothetical protein PR001_g16416 [Phytophthora rubi]KAE9289906.1 hypothetical protein PR003_g25426 [Phytophthora rubi]
MNQPPGNPAEVIDVSTPSPSDEGNNLHIEAMITGRGKRFHADDDEEQRENSAVDSSRLDSKEQAENEDRGSKDRMPTEGEDPKGIQLEEDSTGSEGKRARPGQAPKDKEMKTEEQEPPVQDTDEPTNEPEPMVDLSFSEMYAYLYGEVAGMDVQQAQEVLSAKGYITSMFGKVFASHPAQALPRDKWHYPELHEEETVPLMQLFLLV